MPTLSTVLSLCLIMLFSTGKVFALATNAILLDIPEVEPKDPHLKQQLVTYLHNRHNPIHTGLEDPHFPTFIKFKPSRIELPSGYKLPSGFVVNDNLLDLRSLTPQLLEKLSLKDLKTLMDYLASVRVKIKWSDQEGQTQSGKKMKIVKIRYKHWDDSNAAAALCLSMGVSLHSQVFMKMLAVAPEATLIAFDGHIAALLDVEINAHVIAGMLYEVDQGHASSTQTVKLIAYLVQRGLEYWVGKDITRLNPYLAGLFHITDTLIEDAHTQSPEYVRGLLYGSILAGAIKHIDTIKKIDEQRIWIIGLVANLVWAATCFVGMVPMAAPIAAATAGGISVGAVLSASVCFALDFPRDFMSTMIEIVGNFKMGILEKIRLKDVDTKVDALLMLEALDTAIKVCGYGL